MKRMFIVILIIGLIAGLTACGAETNVTIKESEEQYSGENREKSEQVLIAYLSGKENEGSSVESMETVSEIICEEVNGTLHDIEEETALSSEAFNGYEIIFLGLEQEQGALPQRVGTFLNQYDFGAKNIIPYILGEEDALNEITKEISQIQPGALIQDNGLALSQEEMTEEVLSSVINEWVQGLRLNQDQSLSETADTVLTGRVDVNQQQTFYLWEEGNMPSETVYTENKGGYSDNPDFRPYITTHPAKKGMDVKGAVLINAGGAFQYRSDQVEGTPVAEVLSELGYQSFVVDYRLRPYTQEEGALDLARAVRFVRSHAEDYGIEEEDIAVMGFSAGGILSGEMLLNFDGMTNGSILDKDYAPDELDEVSADAAACGMIYSFYGRLSVASTDVDKFKESDLPPTYFVYGSRDPFVGEFEECIAALREAGVSVESHELQGMPHGFGAEGNWISGYDKWLTEVFST